MTTETRFDFIAKEVAAQLRKADIARVSGSILSVYGARTMCKHLAVHCAYTRPDDKFVFTRHEQGPPLTPEEKAQWTVIA